MELHQSPAANTTQDANNTHGSGAGLDPHHHAGVAHETTSNVDDLLKYNKEWAKKMKQEDPTFF